MEQITSAQLGDNIFHSCLRFAEEKQKDSFGLKGEAKINFEEILVGYMWAIFDFLNTNPRYERATHFLFGGYTNFLNLDKKEADEKMRFLEKRFYEYKNLFRKEDGQTDYNYLAVVTVMTQNITGKDTELLFAVSLGISIQEFILMWAKQLNEIEIIDLI